MGKFQEGWGVIGALFPPPGEDPSYITPGGQIQALVPQGRGGETEQILALLPRECSYVT